MSTAAFYRFDLTWAGGKGCLALPGADTGQGCVDAALALAPALPLLRRLQDWLAQPLQRVQPAAAQPWPDACGALTLPLDEAAVGARLALPWGGLPYGRALPGGWPLPVPAWSAQLLLQTLPAARVPRAAVRPGALLLLPATWGTEGCPVQLHPVPGGPPLPVLEGACWRLGEGRLTFDGTQPLAQASHAAAAPTAENQALAKVWLQAPVAVAPDAWFGGCRRAQALAPAGARLDIAGQACAFGTLVPAGPGWGLRLEVVVDAGAGAGAGAQVRAEASAPALARADVQGQAMGPAAVAAGTRGRAGTPAERV